MRLKVSLRFSSSGSIPIGTLMDYGRDSLFEYDAGFLSRGLSPAPFRLPLGRGVRTYDRSGNMETFGVFEDSLPDGWGRRLLDSVYRKRHGRLAPFYDFTRSEGPNGWQTLSVAGEGRNPTDDDLKRLAEHVGLDASMV